MIPHADATPAGTTSQLLRSATVPLSDWPRDLWDTEVIAAATALAANVLAANVSGDDPFEAEHEVTEWLPKPLPAELLSFGLSAIAETTALGGPWTQSWTTDQSRADASDVIARIRDVLASATRLAG